MERTVIKGIIAALLIMLLSGIALDAQDLHTLRLMWESGQYDEIVPLLANFKPKDKAESTEADYLFASSLCRMHGNEAKSDGRTYLKLLLKYGDLNAKNRRTVSEELNNCGSDRPAISITINYPQPTAGISSAKMLYDSRFSEMSNVPAKIKKILPDKSFWGDSIYSPDSVPMPGLLDNRLYSKTEINDATEFFRRAFPNYDQFGDSTFYILSQRDLSQSQKNSMLEILHQFQSYFIRKYDLEIPEFLITVFLTNNKDELRLLCDFLYGLEVSPMAIGYSCSKYYSMVAVSTGTSISRTSFHELFHVVSDNTPGMVPAWLSEGVASIYEWPSIETTDIRGKDDWRGDVLRAAPARIPFLSELLTMNWGDFNCEDKNFRLDCQSVNYAMARYFMMYLDSENKLAEFYKRIVSVDIGIVEMHPDDFSIKILEDTYDGKPIGRIETDFRQWLYDQYHISIRSL